MADHLRPPGRYGSPLWGRVFDAVDFLRLSGWQAFFENRQQRYGSTVFRTSMVFRKTIVAMDHRAISALFGGTPFIQDYGFGSAIPPRPLVGHVVPSVFETGVLHDNPKSFYLSLLRQRASSLYDVFDDVLSEYETRWAKLGHFSWRDEIEDFAMDFVLRWILELKFDTAKARLIYNNIFTNRFWRVTRFIPWSRYSKSLRHYEELVSAIEGSSRFEAIMEIARQHGLSDRSYVAKQIAFVTGMNSYLGLQSLFKSIAGELSARPDIREDLKQKLHGLSPASLFSPRVPAIDAFVMEVLRQHPPVFFIFGRAIEDVVLESTSGTFQIAKGERLMGVIPFAHLDPDAFPDPASFRPERFQEGEARTKLIWPRGIQDRPADSADRTCPGKDVALLLAHAFCTALVTRYEWTAVQPVKWDRHKYSLNVAAPMGELRVTGFVIRDEHAEPQLNVAVGQ